MVSVNVETKDLTGNSLKATADTFNADKSKGYIDYRHKGFDFDLTSEDEYCVAEVTVKVCNPSNLTTSALYLIPKTDNDVICYLEPSRKAVNVLLGEFFLNFAGNVIYNRKAANRCRNAVVCGLFYIES